LYVVARPPSSGELAGGGREGAAEMAVQVRLVVEPAVGSRLGGAPTGRQQLLGMTQPLRDH
jgi:hypothetical protein